MPYTGLTTCTYGGPDWDVKNDTKVKLANGYTLIGRSGVASYTQYLGSDESIAALKTFAESIGADRVYYGVSEKKSLTTSYSTVVATIWTANFYRRSLPDIFHIEAKFRNLSDDEARKIGTHSGAVFSAVIRGGPAYLADIFEGDIITELNGEKILDAKDFRSKCKELGGSEIVLTLIRDGTFLKKSVRLNP